VTVPGGTTDGRYELAVAAASDEWSVREPVAVEVFRPNLAQGRPVAQSSLGSGGVP
jgi:hypothetical protein